MEDQEIILSESEIEENFKISQFPCDHKMTFEFYLVEGTLEKSLPHFIETEPDSTLIKFSGWEKEDIGNYKIRIYAYLDDRARSFAKTTFEVDIFNIPYVVEEEPSPYFEPLVEDQFLSLSQGLAYPLEFELREEGW